MDPNQPTEINEAPNEYVAEDAPPSGPPIKKILSLVIGAAVVIGIIIVVILVVMPRLSSGGSKNVTLHYWGIWEDSAPLETAAKEFTQKNPNIKVVIEKKDVKSLGKYASFLATRIKNGKGPDVFRYHESWLMQLLPFLMPLPTDVVAATEIDKKYYPTVSSDLKYNGAYYGVPIHFDSLALFINLDLYKNVGISTYPTTWDDLIKYARELTVKDEAGKITQSGIALGTYDNVAHASDIVSLLMIQNKANLTNLSSTKKNAAVALGFYTDFATGPTGVWDDSFENSKLAFSKGQVAMMFGYSWDVFELKQMNPNLNYVIVPVPHLPSRNSTVASYWVDGVSSKTKYPKESFEFLKFLVSRQTMEQLFAAESKIRLFGELYPRSDMARLVKDNKLAYPFVLQGSDAKSTIFAADTYDGSMVDELNKYLGDAVRSILKGGSAESAVDTLSEGVSQKLSQYGGSTTK